jgi:hypothetical protein
MSQVALYEANRQAICSELKTNLRLLPVSRFNVCKTPTVHDTLQAVQNRRPQSAHEGSFSNLVQMQFYVLFWS